MSEGDEVPDPVTVATGKVISTAGSEVVKTTGNLVTRLLGPSADRLGLVLADWSEFRVKNLLHIASLAEPKVTHTEGLIPPRVAHRIIEEGSYSDDELMAEYLSGLLAGSRTPTGKDDRAIAWTELVTGMSALQIRAHFLLYREWANLLYARDDINLGVDAGRQAALLDMPGAEFLRALDPVDGFKAPQSTLEHTVPNLVRMGLLGAVYSWGAKGEGKNPNSEHDINLVVQPSGPGVELFGWALGIAGLTVREFVTIAPVSAGIENAPPRIEGAALVTPLPEIPAEGSADDSPAHL